MTMTAASTVSSSSSSLSHDNNSDDIMKRILATDEDNAKLDIPPENEEEDINNEEYMGEGGDPGAGDYVGNEWSGNEDLINDEEEGEAYDNYGCTLKCENQGICEVLTYIEQFHKNTIPQRCICPPGYGGVLCDIRVNSCFTTDDEKTKHYCQNGSPCIFVDKRHDTRKLLLSSASSETKTTHQTQQQLRPKNYNHNRLLSNNNEQVPSCDCKKAYETSAFAGHECAYPASEYCTESSDLSLVSFCTNGGSCKGYVKDVINDKHPGCDCIDGYEGDHCEYVQGTVRITKDTVDGIFTIDGGTTLTSSISSSGSGGMVFYGLLITLFVSSLLGLGVMIRRWRIRTLAEREIVRQANFVTAELTLRCMKRQSPAGPNNGGGGPNNNMSGGASVDSNSTSSYGGYNGRGGMS